VREMQLGECELRLCNYAACRIGLTNTFIRPEGRKW